MRSFRRFVWPMIAAIAITGGTYFGAETLMRGPAAVAAAQARPAQPAPELQSTESLAQAAALSKTFRAVHDALKDAVVNINVSKKPAAAMRRGTPAIPEELRRLIPPDMDPNLDRELSGTGSGVIIDAEGHILTNNHVVEDASDITVRLNDGRELKGKLVGTDPKTDLAVIKVTADHLVYARFGDSDSLDVGDWVLAFGSPFGFDQTMTQGIISAKGRHVPIIAEHNPALQGLTYENFLQTDAAINPGNSGGPLVNLKGEVVGINAAIASNTGGYNGIGFTIPSNDAQYVMKSLIEHGKVVRGYLGIQIGDVNHPGPKYQPMVDKIRADGFSGSKGVLVSEIKPDGPAVGGAIREGDVITAINGKSVESVDELRNQIARTVPDESIKLTVFRDGKSQEIACKVGTQPDTVTLASSETLRPMILNGSDIGLKVDDVSADTAKALKLDSEKGAEITSVGSGSIAEKLGLKAGSVVIRVGNTEITSAKQFQQVMRQVKLADGVNLTVRNKDGKDSNFYIEKN